MERPCPDGGVENYLGVAKRATWEMMDSRLHHDTKLGLPTSVSAQPHSRLGAHTIHIWCHTARLHPCTRLTDVQTPIDMPLSACASLQGW